MKTPDEIKKYAQTWREVLVDDCVDFPYAVHTMLHTAAGLVESLLTEIEQVRRERDAAVEDLETMGEARPYCGLCAHEKVGIDEAPCGTCREGYIENNWQWRGVQKEVE